MLITDIPYKIRYGIGRLIIGCGVYPATMADLHFIVIDYWGRSSDDIKRKWIKAAKKSETTGDLLINKSLISDMTDYLVNRKLFVEGQNNIYQDTTTTWHVDDGIHYRTIEGWEFVINDGIYSGLWCIRYINGEVNGGHKLESTASYDVYLSCYLMTESDGVNNTKIVAYWYKSGVMYSMQLITLYNTLSGLIPDEIEYSYVGDSAGIGSALAPEQELKVPVPPVSETDWPGGWISTIEIDSNLEDNPTVNYDDVDDSPKDWYEDENGDIYSVPSGTGPNNPGDILLKTKNKSFSYPPIYPPNYP